MKTAPKQVGILDGIDEGLEEIETDEIRVEFQLGDRLDLQGDAAKKLDAIHIYRKTNNELIKSFKFDKYIKF